MAECEDMIPHRSWNQARASVATKTDRCFKTEIDEESNPVSSFPLTKGVRMAEVTSPVAQRKSEEIMKAGKMHLNKPLSCSHLT